MQKGGGGGTVTTTQASGGGTQTSEAGGGDTDRREAHGIRGEDDGFAHAGGAVDAHTGFAKTSGGDNMSETDGASGRTGSGGGGNTGVSRNEGGAMTSTDEAGKAFSRL